MFLSAIMRPPWSFARRVLDGLDDVHVAGAAAEVAGDGVADLVLGRRGDSCRGTRSRSSACPGVQKPHCSPCSAMKPSCSGWSLPSCSSPSTVVISRPSACTAKTVQDLTGSAVEQDRAGAAVARVAADVRAGEPQDLADQVDQEAGAARRRASCFSPLIATVTSMGSASSARALDRSAERAAVSTRTRSFLYSTDPRRSAAGCAASAASWAARLMAVLVRLLASERGLRRARP